jgi:hypothetical protein
LIALAGNVPILEGQGCTDYRTARYASVFILNILGVSMNTAMKLGVAGALAFAGVAAHASIASPSSGSSDAILFAEVVNAAGTAAVASYAGDTGVSISSLTSGISGTSTLLGGDANLAKLFAADASGDTVYFAVLGGQYVNGATTANFKTAGVAQFITTTAGNSTAALASSNTSTLVKFAGINTDITNINTNINGPASSIEGASTAGAGVWDYTNPLGLAYWEGGTANGNAVGSAQNLYYVTAGTPAGIPTKVSYTLEGTASLSAAGLVLAGTGTGTPPPVPLPAAVWLLGSGLLGLTGVARRKLKVQA